MVKKQYLYSDGAISKKLPYFSLPSLKFLRRHSLNTDLADFKCRIAQAR